MTGHETLLYLKEKQPVPESLESATFNYARGPSYNRYYYNSRLLKHQDQCLSSHKIFKDSGSSQALKLYHYSIKHSLFINSRKHIFDIPLKKIAKFLCKSQRGGGYLSDKSPAILKISESLTGCIGRHYHYRIIQSRPQCDSGAVRRPTA